MRAMLFYDRQKHSVQLCSCQFLLLVEVITCRVFQSNKQHQTQPPPLFATCEIPNTDKPYISTVSHVEGSFPDNKDQKVFLYHVDQIRYALDLFDAYGAKATIESVRQSTENELS